jgi:hypothetical protein
VPHVYIHFFGDGRDTAPTSGKGFCKDLLDFLEKEKYGELATLVGRYYAMDRDKRWDRVKIAIDGLVKGEGIKTTKEEVLDEIQKGYDAEKKVTDEFWKPIIVNGDEGRIKGMVLCFYGIREVLLKWVITQMVIPFSSSTTAPIVCVRFPVYSDCLTSPWRSMSPKTWYCLSFSFALFRELILIGLAHYNNVEIQCGVSLPCCFPTSSHDERIGRMVV